jgi:large subunit ribosomal protein L15
MQLHNFPHTSKKRKKRIGRGGGRGTYSGRGIKGQKARAGRRIRPAIRELLSRLPKRRGFRNKPVGPKPLAISLNTLKNLSGEVTLEMLKTRGLISRRYRGQVKIIGKGKITHAFTIKGLLVSKGAAESIQAAGGRVIANNANFSK